MQPFSSNLFFISLVKINPESFIEGVYDTKALASICCLKNPFFFLISEEAFDAISFAGYSESLTLN